jgi:6,7-dimethyl-8-ribityllumazine synthase
LPSWSARWNAVITERLLEGALDALLRSGASGPTSK